VLVARALQGDLPTEGARPEDTDALYSIHS